MQKLLLVEDDPYHALEYVKALVQHGFDPDWADGTDKALKCINREDYAIVVTDIMMDPGKCLAHKKTVDGALSGIFLAEEIKNKDPRIKICAYSLGYGSHNCPHPFDSCFNKADCRPSELAKNIRKLFVSDGSKPNVFIVHGHDKELLLDTKNFVQNRLHLPEPTILGERASGGRSIIEKFEYYAHNAGLVFVLFSPDDTARTANTNGPDQSRARQNVIFEYGYFLGALQRLSDRILLLHKGKLELPSDISGVIYINVTNGVESAGEEIRRELHDLGITLDS
jgi:predicted nucleotide-binding protein